jgi:hypothetical protein
MGFEVNIDQQNDIKWRGIDKRGRRERYNRSI